jgi:hypothetical protein
VKEEMLWDHKISEGWVISQNALLCEEMKLIFVAHRRAMSMKDMSTIKSGLCTQRH